MTVGVAEAGRSTVTVDAFVGGRVEAVQPARGHHRSGLEAVLLGAALEADFAGTIVDLGAGAGVAGMIAAARCAAARVVLADRDAEAVACARMALERPANRAFASRVSVVVADVEAAEAAREAAGLARAMADAVVTNPPFHVPATTTAPPGQARAAAHVLGEGGLDLWFRAAASVLKPGGRLVVVFRADGIAQLLAALGPRFGAIDILPVLPRAGEPAHRILVRALKGSRAATRLLPQLVLHGATGGTYLSAVDGILRDGAGLAEAHPVWAPRAEFTR
jgi:tRNA1(Val) A37 N6-methylase TrmN6